MLHRVCVHVSVVESSCTMQNQNLKSKVIPVVYQNIQLPPMDLGQNVNFHACVL